MDVTAKLELPDAEASDSTTHGSSEQPSPEVLRRLAFIRYLYRLGLEQSRQPEPMAASAILVWHDAADLYLQLLADHLGVDPGKKPVFGDYITALSLKLDPRGLAQAHGMRQFNEVRTVFKHNGMIPSWESFERFAGTVATFLEENTATIFGIDFSGISLVELVKCETAKESLADAVSKLQSGETADAMIAAAIAFDQLLFDLDRKFMDRYGRSPIAFGESFTFDSAFFRHRGRDPLGGRDQARFEDKLMKSVVALQEAAKIIALGIDYRKYARFKLATPVIHRALGGQYHVTIGQGMRDSPTWPPKLEASRFCIDFVIDAAIRIQQFGLEP